MANLTITQLPTAGALTGQEVVPIVQNGVTVQTTTAAISGSSVNSVSFGTTGLTPSTATTGAIVVSGILNVSSGGTGATSLTGYVYGNGTGAFTSSTTIPTSALTGNFVSTFSGGSTGLTPSSATAGAISLSGVLAVAYGGTGVTASTGVSSVVLRDSNANITYNNVAPSFTDTTTAAGTTTLTAASSYYQHFSGTSTQTVKFPDETTIPVAVGYIIDNDSTGNVTVQDSAGNPLATALPGGAGFIYSLSNSTATGNWAGYLLPPGNSATGLITWGSAGLNLAGSYLSGVNLFATNSAAPTIASATTIAPTKSITFISGTTAIATITAPSPISTSGGQITLIPTGVFTTTTAGNIALASTAVVNKALIMTYDSGTAKWYPSY